MRSNRYFLTFQGQKETMIFSSFVGGTLAGMRRRERCFVEKCFNQAEQATVKQFNQLWAGVLLDEVQYQRQKE